MEKKMVLAGGTGFLGQSFAHYLVDKGYKVIVLTRTRREGEQGINYVIWDGRTLSNWCEELEESYAVVNFTGKSVNCIYTPENKREIIESRLDSVKVVDAAVKQVHHPPQVIIQAGSLAIYGNTRQLCDETARHGQGFSVEVCEKWEEAFFKERIPDTRKVMFRIGFVLGENGGALEPLMKLAKYYLGGTVGNGQQYISWLHINDLNKMLLEAIEKDVYEGIYNATGDSPVTNKVFMKTLRSVMNKPWSPPAPAPLVRLGAYTIMKADPNLALAGRKCISKRLKEHQFEFNYSDLTEALEDIIK